MSSLLDLSIKEINKGLASKEFSARELTQTFIDHIQTTDGNIKAYLRNDFDGALTQADEVDKKISIGDQISPIAGVPSAIKDNILIKGTKTTAASKILENYTASYDATVVKKLKRDNAIFLGKTNMDEFAMGSSTENSAFQQTKNPHDLERVPGGSSGGSAAAVASRQAIFALGSDTGGSIRQPASFCGAVGLKPTYGSVSRFGLMAMASSLDQIGVFARSIEDTRTVFDIIKGKDENDSTSMGASFKAGKKGLKGIKIGMPKEYFSDGIDAGVKEAVVNAIKNMEKAGAEIKEVSLPHTRYAISAYYIIMPAEVSSNLARYDGIKYGYSVAEDAKHRDLESVYLRSRSQGFGKEAKRRVMLGTYVLSAGYYDAYYKKAQQVRAIIMEDFKKAFEQVDILATPTSPTVAFKFGEKTEDPLSMYMADVFTVPINLAGLPAISMPCGTSENLPVGLQLIAPWFEEETLFNAGEELEKINS